MGRVQLDLNSGSHKAEIKVSAPLLPEGCGEDSTSKLILVVDRIQFLVATEIQFSVFLHNPLHPQTNKDISNPSWA